MLRKLGLKDGEAIVHPWINKALEKAQQKVEARNFDIRKNLLKFDDVMNDQRKVIFEQRIDLMKAEDISETVADMREEVIEELVAKHIPAKAYAEQWDVDGLRESVRKIFNVDIPVDEWAKEEGIVDEDIIERLLETTGKMAKEKAERFGEDVSKYVEKSVTLQALDGLWREHLVNLDHLRSVVGFRGYGQRDPLQEYKGESFELFQTLLLNLRETVTTQMALVDVVQNDPNAPPVEPVDDVDAEIPAEWQSTGRNEPCPCGSGNKFKHCHGKYV